MHDNNRFIKNEENLHIIDKILGKKFKTSLSVYLMYGDWLVVRPQFSKLFNTPDIAIETFLNYIQNDKFLPCSFIGSKEHWIEAIKYSIKGEIGYTLWGSGDMSSSTGINNRYQEAYIKKDGNRILPSDDRIMVAVLRVSGLGIIGFGLVTDVETDAIRSFIGWHEDDRYWITRFRIKIFWLHESIRNNPTDYDRWQGDNIELEGTNTQTNNCYTKDNHKAINSVKRFILSKKDEIKPTLEFYINLLRSEPQIKEEAITISSKINCKNSNNDVKVEDVYLPQGITGIIIKSLEKGNVLFIGPPGVGKTKLALELVKSLSGNDECFNIVTANSLWFRRTLIGGESIREGSVIWKSGLLIQAYVKASKVNYGNYYIIIDEINRADVDKAFGELFTIFSSSNPKDWFIPRALIDEIKSYGDKVDEYTKEFFNIYEDLRKQGKENEPLKKIRIIATLNLTDARNLFYVGDALTRRFTSFYFDYPKGTEDLDKFLRNYNLREEEKEEIRDLVKYLREKLEEKDKIIKFNISPASLKSALEIYSSFYNRNIDNFILILKSTLGTLNQDKIDKVNKLIDNWKEIKEKENNEEK
ncbi:McrB family protein [Saccharolobus islandicus]|uniref:McrB family protein n=1 Tax=Saccharolobus islandicus TaxID=43080 RepID=UPI00037E7816|nr:AAA family ATPase [Sulfolobus islandicus]